MTNVAVIGLGIMGLPMAINLVKAGHNVIGFNRSPARIDQLVAAGGRGAANIIEAVREADVVITMLPDSPDVEDVVGGPDGVFANTPADATWIDTSTIRPDVTVRLATAAREAGLKAVDAPVSGGEAGAIEGTLSIMVGGDAADVEAIRGVLDAMGSTVVHVGPAGSGQTVKAANQLIVAGTIQLVAEALVFLEAHSVDTQAAVTVLAGGLAGNRILDRKAASMLERRFEPGFRVDLHHKDLGIVTAAARAAGVAIPLGAVVAQLMGALRAEGHGSLDHSALLLLVEQMSGRSPVDTPTI
ncbi:2-hydroxy-3-oxopropionate reductase [Cryobacterium sp. Hb1]|uniref:2-hydroxy-3-oxopropionate reductase n=1 Tax=Cryobacterium sp. Hb1 TaxID=1259147 RepID=UPI00106D4CD5|nr:2-hydroxy-3-oxopropionate reductase [Cryobacterium sp. Hb1]TFD71617.1 2-hydroxy-3-oxopropionate reductase [Cryobacterium sp. Hb1]